MRSASDNGPAIIRKPSEDGAEEAFVGEEKAVRLEGSLVPLAETAGGIRFPVGFELAGVSTGTEATE